MTRRTLLPLSVLLALAAGCAGANASRRGPAGGLKLRCTPADATVYVDDEYRGACTLFAQHALPLPAGSHRVQVEASGRFPYYGEVDTAGILQTLEVVLVPRPD
jgi:hypothetical protein